MGKGFAGRLIVSLTSTLALSAIFALAVPGGPARAKAIPEATAAREAGEPIMAIVSIKTQHITIYDADGWIYRAPVSSGVKGRETPAGVFAIVQKNADHRSNLYDDAWMPHMQRLTWNGIALHGGPLPGYAASHGCVRMPFGFAEKLFDKTRLGMRVIVSPYDADPVEFSHPSLLIPNAEALGDAPLRAAALEREATQAAKSDDEARKAAAKATRDLAVFKVSLRRLEGAKTRAEADLAQAVKALEAATTDQARARAEELKLKADAKVADIGVQLEAVRADEKAKVEAATQGSETAKAAAVRRTETAKAAKEAKLALEPVSVYISRATQKVYVRRNTRKPWPDGGEVYDFSIEARVKIRDPEKPIGTHIFTAMSRSDTGLRWSAVTIDKANDAMTALDRITIPQEILDRIAPTAFPRSSIIVSDEPLSKETNYRTEFVTVLSNQPQGGFITRKPTPVPPMASASPWDFGGYGFLDQRGYDRRSGDRRRRDGYRERQRTWQW